MCGCWSRAAIWISRRKRSAPIEAARSGTEHLDRDFAVVLEVLGEVDGGHPARSELAPDRVAAAERRAEARLYLVHGPSESRLRLLP